MIVVLTCINLLFCFQSGFLTEYRNETFLLFFLNKIFPTFKIAKYLWVYCLLAVHATLKLT